MAYIQFSSKDFNYRREINNDYDFEIAVETINKNLHNIIERKNGI